MFFVSGNDLFNLCLVFLKFGVMFVELHHHMCKIKNALL